jgi:hypothetical protein
LHQVLSEAYNDRKGSSVDEDAYVLQCFKSYFGIVTGLGGCFVL